MAIHRRSVVPRAVWALMGLFALLLLAWSLLAPLDDAPDEQGHADLIFHLATGASYPRWDERKVGHAVFATALTHRADVGKVLFVRGRWLTPESAAPRARRPTFSEAGGDRSTKIANQIPQHPPLYYEVGSVLLRAERKAGPGAEPLSLEREWYLVRLLGVLLLAPLPFLAWATARRLGAPPPAAVGAAVVPLAIPQLLHVGSAVNNDNLLTLLCGVVALLLAGVIRGDLRRSTALGVGVVAGLALLTKGFALVLPLWFAAAYAVPAWRSRRLRASAQGLAIATGAALVVGGWWWVRQLIREGGLAPSLGDRPYGRISHAGGEAVSYLPRFAGWMAHRFWGDFGYFDASLPIAVVAVASVIAAVAIAAALVPRLRTRWTVTEERGPARLELAALGSLFAVLLVVLAVKAYGPYRSSGDTAAIQGRYLFAAIVPFSVVVGVGAARLLG